MSPSKLSQLPANLVIPTLPSVVLKINELLADPDRGMREIGEIVAQDAPLCAKVLRIANSSYYGMHQPCVSAEQACSMLGVKVLKNVVMQVAVIKHYDHLNDSGFDMNELWSHAIKTAQACSFLAQRSRARLPIGPDDFYTCGLLHDLGQVVLLDGMGESYVRLLKTAAERNLPRYVAETRVLGYNHTELGALIAERWSLPDPVCNAIRGHHGPREAVEGDPVTSLVANANLLVERLGEGKLNAAANVFDADTTRFLGLNGQDVIDLIEHLTANAEAAVV